MAHYAKVNSQGIVEQVIVAEQDVIDSGLFGNPTGWVQTSYNTHGGVHANGGTPLRKNYAGIGYTYDIIRDAFIPPKPFASWTLNEDTCLWDSPVAMPTDGKIYSWDESQLNWVEVVIPETPVEAVVEAPAEVVIPAETNDTATLTESNVDTITLSSVEPTISLDLGTGSDTVTGSATPTI